MKDSFEGTSLPATVVANDNTPLPVTSPHQKRSLRLVASTEAAAPDVHIHLQLLRKCASDLLQFSGLSHTILVSEHEARSKQNQIAGEARQASMQMLSRASSLAGISSQTLAIMVFRQSSAGICGPTMMKIDVKGASRLTVRQKEELALKASQHVLTLLAARQNFSPRIA